jgi:uncharacterized membrane protein
MMTMGQGMAGTGWWLGWLPLALLALGIAALVTWLVRRPPDADAAATVLRERFARGEIDEATLAAGLAVLERTRPTRRDGWLIGLLVALALGAALLWWFGGTAWHGPAGSMMGPGWVMDPAACPGHGGPPRP